MIPFLNSLSITAGVGGGPSTYAEFQALISAMATNGTKTWGSSSDAGGVEVGSWRTTVGSGVGIMYGSPWLGFVMLPAVSPENRRVSRIIQHSMPSSTVFSQQSGKDVFFRVAGAGTRPPEDFPSLSRNGYNSLVASGGAYPSGTVDLVLLWDDALNTTLAMAPGQGLGPSPYS